jgi:CheY-like chemotaxis protein
VYVTDTGMGIAPDMLRGIFDLFAQAERSGRRPAGGLGIGLTLARRLVELHGGTITASSDGLGRGSRFTVRLPLAVGVTALLPPGPGRPGSGSRRVLVIEDNDDARESLVVLLESLGHRVLDAMDGVRGVTVALEACPDVVLIDLGLPALDGFRVAQTLRSTPAGKRMTLIAVTGYGQPDDRDRSEQAGFDAHVVKPVNPEILSGLLGGPA